ncbi:tyrosine-protein phosphatase [Aureibacter tunicatorum]|uniref:Protein-tyrosine phosphatase n=1 Tax=Aureibacter tunicatorum TaxID=866807 RepID=A0AAE3XKT0_9BACT|nr:tyrosine-protein phosphatase [Aureibacter tunicatorum]MDR6238252.1 protein-tyrosine phosphatase [Aureibacter tunicatorum]BDD03285.1 protein-tyrosine-phosphatase [Aureibacter tunicatorum]
MKKIKHFIKATLFIASLTACEQKKATKQASITETPQMENKTITYEHEACQDTFGIELPSNCDHITPPQKFDGLENFREIFISKNSEIKIKKGILFRSDAFYKLSTEDSIYLEGLEPKVIVDFRSEEEIIAYPDKKISSIQQIHHIKVGSDPSKFKDLIDNASKGKIRDLFINQEYAKVDSILKDLNINLRPLRKERYASFALNHNKAFGDFMRLLTDKNNFPIVFHCQGGKDRTGFASALILKTLGLSEQDILDDYLMTNFYGYENLKKAYATNIMSLRPTYGAHTEQIKSSFKAIEENYGTFDNYLSTGLHLTDEEVDAIRTNLLEVEL